MKINGLPLATCSLVLSATCAAQPVLLTELRPNDNRITAQYTQTSFEDSYSGMDQKVTTDADGFLGEAVVVTSQGKIVTPFIALGVNRQASEDEKVVVRTAAVGGLFSIEGDRKALFAFGQNKSNDTNLVRDNFNGRLAFQMSEPTDSTKHELTVAGTFQRKTDIVNGGHSFGITNRSKFALGAKSDVIINLGAQLQTELKYEGPVSERYNPYFVYGADLNLHPSKYFTIQLSLAQTDQSGELKNGQTSTDFDREITTTTMTIMSRF